MPPDTDIENDDTVTEEPRPLELHELTAAAEHMARIHRANDAAAFFGDLGSEGDLVPPEADAPLKWLEENNLTVLANDFRTRQEAARAEAARVAEETAKASREKLKESLKKKAAEQDAAHQQALEEDRLRHELIAEIEAEARAAATSTTPSFEDEQISIIEQSLETVRNLDLPLEERAAAADRATEAQRVLSEQPVTFDVAGFLDDVNAELEQRKE